MMWVGVTLPSLLTSLALCEHVLEGRGLER